MSQKVSVAEQVHMQLLVIVLGKCGCLVCMDGAKFKTHRYPAFLPPCMCVLLVVSHHVLLGYKVDTSEASHAAPDHAWPML